MNEVSTSRHDSKSRWQWGASALVLAIGATACAEIPDDTTHEDLGSSESSVLDGTRVNPADYPAVGMVRSASGAGAGIYDTGTGTLVGSRYVVTAAHVVEKQWAATTRDMFVEFDSGGGKVRYDVDSFYIHPSYLQYMRDPYLNKLWQKRLKEGVFDVALLILKAVPPGITPVPLSTAIPAPSTAVSFLGYGKIGTGGGTPVDNVDDVLYRGTNTLNFVDQTYARYTYDRGTSGTYKGDSGGPVLIGSALAAVTTSTTGYTYGSTQTTTRVGTIAPWISGLMPNGGGMFAPDAYESVEQNRAPFALNTIGHYSEPRSFTNSADVDTISFQLTGSSRVRISAPHHFDWTTPVPTVTVTKNGATVPMSNPNAALYEATLDAGTYVATVKNNYARGLSYTLGISTDGWFVQGDAYEPDTQQVPLFQLGELSHHNIMPVNDEDYSGFQLSARSNVRIETLPMSGNPLNDRSADTVVTLMTMDETVLAENDDAPNTYCSLIEATLDPGNYLVKVGGYMGKQLSYYGVRVSTY